MGDAVKLTEGQRAVLLTGQRYPNGFGKWCFPGSQWRNVDQLSARGLVRRTARAGWYVITESGLSALTSKEQNNG